MKNRSQTIQQRFGFDDADLKTSKHDEIMLWLNGRAEEIIKGLLNWDERWPQKIIGGNISRVNSVIAERKEKLEDSIKEKQKITPSGFSKTWIQAEIESCKGELNLLNTFASLGDLPAKTLRIEKVWEKPVIQVAYKTEHIVGFVDMLACVYAKELRCRNLHYDPRSQRDILEVDSGKLPEWDAFEDGHPKSVFAFEVKSTIPSLGELIRQLRMYQQYSNFKFYVVSPETRFIEPLNEQGFGFISYPEGNSHPPKS